MSSPIMPTTAPLGHSSQPPTPAGQEPTQSFARVMAADPEGHIDVTRGAPPAEVLDQVRAAAAINDQLRDRGLEVRFMGSGEGARAAIELVDRSGATVRTLTVDEAIEIAAGRPVG